MVEYVYMGFVDDMFSLNMLYIWVILKKTGYFLRKVNE